MGGGAGVSFLVQWEPVPLVPNSGDTFRPISRKGPGAVIVMDMPAENLSGNRRFLKMHHLYVSLRHAETSIERSLPE